MYINTDCNNEYIRKVLTKGVNEHIHVIIAFICLGALRLGFRVENMDINSI